MLRSSLGFHTMTLSMVLLQPETSQLFDDLKKYKQETGGIKEYPDDYGNWIYKFDPNTRGIEWTIRQNIWLNTFRLFVSIIDVKINPKILGGISDYITAATLDDMERAIPQFNTISKTISPLLGTFDDYSLNRVDYCVNLYLPELYDQRCKPCTDMQIMKLIKKSGVPSQYKEWMKYDDKAHRMKSKDSSFYLMSKSARINCYSKFMKLVEQSKENEEKGYPPIPQATLDDARGIIRFEVQCDYHKMYALAKQAEKAGNRNINKYEYLLSPEVCREIVNSFWNKSIGKGHWYSLQHAVTLIRSHNFNSQKEDRLIQALQWVNQCRSIPRAKELFPGDLGAFNRILKELSNLCINPVTIPQEWGVDRIWNLLETYYSKTAPDKLALNNPISL